MRSSRTVILLLFALVLTAVPAHADPMDVTDVSGFGSTVLGPVSATFTFAPGLTADVQTTVYLSSSGVYTYVYQLSNSTGPQPINVFSIGSALFDSSLHWGTVTGSTSSGVGLDSPDATGFNVSAPFCAQNGFLGCSASTLTFFFSDGTGTSGGLDNGETLTIYAQSYTGPGTNPVPAILIDTDHALGNIPAPVPEPGTMVLFGTGLLGLAAAIRRRMAG